MSKETWQQFAIVPRSMEPVTTIFEKTADDALIAFATSMDTDMNLYFKAVPEKLLKTGTEVKPNQWLEAVITTYSYDSPVVTFFTSQEDAIQYIKTSMNKELQYDREGGHDDSILETLEDELFGMKLTTFRNDGSEDTISMILAQSVYTGDAPTPAQPKEEKFPQMARWKRSCLCLTADEFNDICAKIYGADTIVHYAMDGIWLEGVEDEDVDASLNEELSKFFDMNITSVHIDDCDNTNVWIDYKEGARK